MGGRSGIETLLGIMDEAFRGGGLEQSRDSQALLPNLAGVTDDAHHAGEINHLRSTLGADDRWRHIQQGFG